MLLKEPNYMMCVKSSYLALSYVKDSWVGNRETHIDGFRMASSKLDSLDASVLYSVDCYCVRKCSIGKKLREVFMHFFPPGEIYAY